MSRIPLLLRALADEFEALLLPAAPPVDAPADGTPTEDAQTPPAPPSQPEDPMADDTYTVPTGGDLNAGTDAGTTPPPPPPAGAGVMEFRTLEMTRIVCAQSFHEPGGGNYLRFQSLEVWQGASATTSMLRMDLSQNAVKDHYRPAKTYTLLVDGQQRGQVVAAFGQALATCTVNCEGMTHGWHDISFGNLDNGECCPKWFIFYNVPGQPQPELMPVVEGTYELSKRHDVGVQAWTWMPTSYTPRAVPLDHFQQFTPFNYATQNIRRDELMPHFSDMHYLPNISKEGVISSYNMEPYFYDAGPINVNAAFTSKYPAFALYDGPRGVGTLWMTAHLGVGKATWERIEGSPFTNTVYGCDPWRVFKVHADGTITTLAGYRHEPMMNYWKDIRTSRATMTLVGNWNAIPVERRGFHELWGLAWDSSTLNSFSATERLNEFGFSRPTHTTNPVMFVTDSQNNRVCKLEFNGRDRSVPAVITEWLVGLADPWDIVEYGTSVLVSIRHDHAIREYDKATGALVRTVVERNPALPGDAAPLPGTQKRVMGLKNCTLAEAQAQPCLGPEGLYVLDDWLYYGSFVQRQVRRIHLIDGTIEVVPFQGVGGNAKYIKLAVSDGSFGPKGTLFVQSWEGLSKAGHEATLPGGARWSVPAGGDAYVRNTSYGAAVAVGHGAFYTGHANAGIQRYYLGAPTDDNLLTAGWHEFYDKHYRIKYGPDGFGPHGIPLPWGESEAMDYFFLTNGHVPT